MVNLLDNSIKFTGRNGIIHINITEIMENNERVMHISVEDDGLGFEPIKLNKIIQKLSQNDSNYKIDTGLDNIYIGLGLTISNKIA